MNKMTDHIYVSESEINGDIGESRDRSIGLQKFRAKWNHESISLLIQFVEDEKLVENVDNKKIKKNICYEEIVAKLHQKGYMFSKQVLVFY